MKIISPQSEYTFDDLLLLPSHSNFSINEEEKHIRLNTKVSKNISLKIPIVSSPMPGVTESEMAITMASFGGIGIIHSLQSKERQIAEVKKVKQKKYRVGASIDTFTPEELRHCENLLKAGVDLLSLESVHADNAETLAFLKQLKKKYPKSEVSVAHVVTPEAVLSLIKAGADSIRVGIGGGSHCTTRLVTGAGRPQVSAVMACAKIAKKYGVPLISDGGIKYPGDVAKAIAAGAQAVMIGGLLSGTDEAPGEIMYKNGRAYKMSWGVCTDAAALMKENAEEKAKTTLLRRMKNTAKKLLFHTSGNRIKIFEEGVENFIPYKGSAREVIQELVAGTRRSMWYVGAKNFAELQTKAKMVIISASTGRENAPRI